MLALALASAGAPMAFRRPSSGYRSAFCNLANVERAVADPDVTSPFSRVFTDSHHVEGEDTTDGMLRFSRVLDTSRWPNALARGYLRGLAIFWLGRWSDLFLVNDGKAARVLIILEAFTRRRRVVLLDLMPQTPHALRALRFRIVDAPSMRQAVRQAHVFTPFEVDRLASLYGMSPSRFEFIHFPMLMLSSLPVPSFTSQPSRRVIASGRAACDWRTLLAAAEGADWELTIICDKADLPLVECMNHGQAKVLCDIPQRDHDRLVSEAAVFALCLREINASSGHVRLSRAIQLGVPVVAAATRSMAGYARDGETALTYPPGDAQTLRQAIDRLLAQPELRTQLARSAYSWASNYPLSVFVEARRASILKALDADAGCGSRRTPS